eukprot:14843158-Alexandrium_andersonii.AAC.1
MAGLLLARGGLEAELEALDVLDLRHVHDVPGGAVVAVRRTIRARNHRSNLRRDPRNPARKSFRNQAAAADAAAADGGDAS